MDMDAKQLDLVAESDLSGIVEECMPIGLPDPRTSVLGTISASRPSPIHGVSRA